MLSSFQNFISRILISKVNFWKFIVSIGFQSICKGAYIKYVGGGAGGFYKFFKKTFRSTGDHRPKYFMVQ